MSDTLKLGEIITTEQHRDAVHVAVAPVVAGMALNPGDHVGFINDGDSETVGPVDEPIGIIDPFLAGEVFIGQRVWLFLYPGSITSLRHDWTHPAFRAVESRGNVDESRRFIGIIAESLGVSTKKLIQGAEEWLASGSYMHGGDDFEGASVPGEFWKHFEIVTGKYVAPDDRVSSFFSCSC